MADAMPSAEYADRVRAWAGALASGSSQTWTEFLTEPASAPGAPRPAGPLPGAAQLELVRRMTARTDDLPEFERFADLVLGTAGPGRGLVDVPLPWPGADTGGRVGTPPVVPEELPAEEVLRVCAGVLARLLAAEADDPGVTLPRRRRPWRRGFTLLGAPTTAAVVREALLAQGLREGGSRTTWFVLGGPFEDLMTQRWSARVRAGAGLRWQRMWRAAATNDRIPPAIALPRIAEHLVEELTPSRVHVVLAEDPSAALAVVGEILGVPVEPVENRYDVLATDLLRRVNPVLTLAVGEQARRRAVDRAWPQIASGDGSGPLAAPAAHVDWAITTGERIATRLRGGRYAVHGDPALVVPTRRSGVRRSPDADEVLAHALSVLARAWRRDTGKEH